MAFFYPRMGQKSWQMFLKGVDCDEMNEKALFLHACEKGHADVVDLMLQDTELNGTLFGMARLSVKNEVETKYPGILSSLADFEFLDKMCCDLKTGLLVACVNDRKDVVETLLKHGADLNIEYCERKTAFIFACERGCENVVAFLLEHGIDTEQQAFSSTALMFASKYGHVNIVQMLVEHGANVNACNSNHQSCAMFACMQKERRVLELLVSAGASLSMKDACGKTALMYAAEMGSSSVVKCLLEQRVSVDEMDRYLKSALMYACVAGHKTVVKLLLKYGADVNLYEPYGPRRISNRLGHVTSALIESAKQGDEDIMKLLIDHNAYADVRGSKNKTALIFACERNHERVVEMLVTHTRCDVNRCDDDGLTALMHACLVGSEASVRHLISKQNEPVLGHGDVRERIRLNERGGQFLQTALMNACECGDDNIVNLLAETGEVDLDVRNSNGKTALMYATSRPFLKVVAALLKHGADTTLRCNSGTTCLGRAVQRGDLECIKLLHKFGAPLEIGTSFPIAVNFNFIRGIDYFRQRGKIFLENGELKPSVYKFKGCLSPDTATLIYLMEHNMFNWGMCGLDMNCIHKFLKIALRVGVCPGWVDERTYTLGNGTDKDFSLLTFACLKKYDPIIEMILEHLYFYPNDYTRAKSILLSRGTRYDSPLVQEFVGKPMSLFAWSFLQVSKDISLSVTSCGRPQYVARLPIPEKLKERLKFTVW